MFVHCRNQKYYHRDVDKTYILSIAYGHCIPKPVNGVRRRFTCDPLQQKVSYAFRGVKPPDKSSTVTDRV